MKTHIEYLVYTTNKDRFGLSISCKDMDSAIEQVKDIMTRYPELSISITPIEVFNHNNKKVEVIEL